MIQQEIIEQIDFEKVNGLVPAIIQDSQTGKVLMLGYMNQEALKQTIQSRRVTFFSRSKQRLWTKGEESGNYLNLVTINIDCDNDTLLIKAQPEGPVCHTGTDTCWKEENKEQFGFLYVLEDLINDRKLNPQKKSYTSKLFKKGINKIAQKVGEEAVELVIEAKDSNDDLFINEGADLLYHLLVLLSKKDIPLNKIVEVLKSRHTD